MKKLPITRRVTPVGIPSGRTVLCPACKSPANYAHDAFANPSVLVCGICGVEYLGARPTPTLSLDALFERAERASLSRNLAA